MRDNTYNGRLTINGAVISAQTPVFRRIFGGGNNTAHSQGNTESRTATSENINYTPDLWLRPYLQRAEGEVTYDYRTVFTTTLPVRY